MPMYPATVLEDVWQACNPDQPLGPDDSRYVDLNPARCEANMAKTIGRAIRGCGQTEFLHKLVTGHRGSGKTTELLRVKETLERDGSFVVYVDIEKMLDLGDINYKDVLLVIVQALGDSLEEKKIKVDALLLQEIEDWFSQKVLVSTEEDSDNRTASAGLEISGTLPFLAKLLGKATAEIKSASANRKEIRKNLDQDLSRFLSLLQKFVLSARMAVQAKGKANLVVIVDGLEKAIRRDASEKKPSTHVEIFMHHADQLKISECHVIYTAPMSLVYEAHIGDAWPDEYYLIPMIKLRDRNNKDWQKGRNALWEVVRKRVDVDAVFETPDTIEDFISLSGGAVRDLLRLFRRAYTYASGDRIDRKVGQKAIAAYLRDESRLIPEKGRTVLQDVADKKDMPSNSSSVDLLHNRLIHEYQNGERWADVHPAVKYLLDLPGKPDLITYAK